MNLSRNIFWDVDYDTLDWEKHSRFVICRVLERGEMNDWFEIKKYYGVEKIKEAAVAARSLNPKVLHFCSNYFQVPLNQFRCYHTPPWWIPAQ